MGDESGERYAAAAVLASSDRDLVTSTELEDRAFRAACPLGSAACGLKGTEERRIGDSVSVIVKCHRYSSACAADSSRLQTGLDRLVSSASNRKKQEEENKKTKPSGSPSGAFTPMRFDDNGKPAYKSEAHDKK